MSDPIQPSIDKIVKFLTGQLSIEAFPESMRPRLQEMAEIAAEEIRKALDGNPGQSPHL